MVAVDRTPVDPAPPREKWPEPDPESPEGEALTRVALTTFHLYGRLMSAAEDLAAEGGITASWWQVLGGVIDEPRTVPEVARQMGMTRQGVQRVADLLVERGLGEYLMNPAHRTSRLLACTEAGYWAIRRITLAQHPWADRVGSQVGARDLHSAAETMERLVAVLNEFELADGSRNG